MGDAKPKYLNSPETMLFDKSKNLYGMNIARSSRSGYILICEGYMDVIALHAAGFENAVATLGTAITSEQARIFSRYTKKVIISYDSDQAGQRAADKAFKLLQEVGVDVKILKMEGAKDPDEFIKKFGATKFTALLDDSKSRFEFELDKVLAKYDIRNVDEKIKASHELCKIITTFSSEVERELYARKMASVFDVPLASVQKDISSIIKRRIREDKSKQQSELYRITSGLGDRVNPESASNIRANKIEEAILGLMLLKVEHMQKCVETLTADSFVTPFSKKVFESISSIYKEYGKFDIGYIQEDFSIEQISRITKMLTERERITKNDSEALENLIVSLEKEHSKKEDFDSFDDILKAIKNKKSN